MKKLTILLATVGLIGSADAQFQVNPQMGLTYQNLTSPYQGISYRGAVGWQLGADLRFGDRLFFQPGVFLGRNATVVKANFMDSVMIEDNLVRTNLTMKALVGYRIIDSYQFDLRFVAGPTYDVLMSIDDKDDKLGWNEGDFNKGSFNFEAGLGFDMGHVTIQPTASFGLSRVYSDNLEDFDSKYLTYGLTIGVNFGDDDN
jgi:hypothetical protein